MWMLFLLLASAFAQSSVTMCIRVNVDYTDMEVGDRWDDSGDVSKPARGFHARVWDETASAWVWPGVFGAWGVLEDGDTLTGCTDAMNLVNGHEYSLHLRSRAVVDGHTISAYDDDTSLTMATATPISGYEVTSSVSLMAFVQGSTEPRWNHLALAAFALKMHDGNGVNETLDIYEDGQNCGHTVGHSLHLGGSGGCARRKFPVAHEIGHAVSNWSDPGGGNGTENAAVENCNGGGPLKKVYAKSAFIEGAADLYTALTWNTLTSGSCDWARNPLDFDLNGSDNTALGDAVPCVDDPIGGVTPDPDDRDWLEDLVNGDDDNDDNKQCNGTLANRLTDFDFLRYAWEMLTEEGLTVSDFWTVWDEADVRTSDADDNDTSSHGSTSTDDDTLVRWEAACDDLGFGSEHDDRADHGLLH